MELYLLRHGIAVERGTLGFNDDSKRPLRAEGRQKMNQIAKGIKTLNLSFNVVLSSPYIRAKETATFVSDQIILTKNLLPEAPAQVIIKELNTKYPKAQSILLVGHEPHLSNLVSFLLTGNTSMEINFKKSGLCSLTAEFSLQPKHVRLNWLLSPTQLRKLC